MSWLEQARTMAGQFVMSLNKALHHILLGKHKLTAKEK